MRIGIIGTGNVATSLGAGLTAVGHDVLYGARNPDSVSVAALRASAPNATVASQPDAIDHGDVVIIATPPEAIDSIAELPGWDDKIVIDTTNNIDWTNIPTVAAGPSPAHRLAERLPTAQVVKAFNTIGAEHMTQPTFEHGPPVMFVCSDHPDARHTVLELAEQLGFEPIDAGPLANAPALEHIAAMWIYLAISAGRGRNIAFNIIHHDPTT